MKVIKDNSGYPKVGTCLRCSSIIEYDIADVQIDRTKEERWNNLLSEKHHIVWHTTYSWICPICKKRNSIDKLI
jgi:hypothetical protein